LVSNVEVKHLGFWEESYSV